VIVHRYLRPSGLLTGPEAARAVGEGRGLALNGGPVAFTALEQVRWDGQGDPVRDVRPLTRQDAGELAAFETLHDPPFDLPRLMGVLNVTPDSFSDGGRRSVAEAVAYGAKLVEDGGADMVDVGGESTRPGASEVAVEEEIRRVLPVVEGLVARGIMVSIDTRKSAVMRAAVEAGARMINDVSGLTFDPDAAEAAAAAAEAGAWVVLMHMRETPLTMNRAPAYRACGLEVMDELALRLASALAAGVPRSRVVLDPGLCFAKHEPHNVELLRDLSLLHGLACPLLVGVSRKGWAAWIEQRHRPLERLPSSLAAAQWALDRGARLLRVHDVAATRQMIDSWVTLARW
jgi:dihydropteroate synthase